MLGSILGTALVATFCLLLWNPWSSSDIDWVKQTSNKSEQVQDQATPPAPQKPAEEAKPNQQEQEFDKTKEEGDDEPVLFAEEEVKTEPSAEQPAEKLNDAVVNKERPTEAERFSTLTADKKVESEDYVELTSGARMIASDLDLRVESSSVKEFNSVHFDRLVKMLNQPEYKGRELYLVGIAGSVGSHFIAKNRADFAKEILIKKYNINIAITTFGVEPHTDEPARGQRLEAWVK